MASILLIAVLVSALIFEFINGFHDTANAIATTVYTKALPLRTAIIMSAIMNFIGALMSEKVAMTIASGLVDIQLQLYVIFAALMGAIIWDLFTWWFSIPSSSSHALIGSLIGATIVFTGSTGHILWAGVIEKVVIPLFTSPLIGMALGYFIMKLVFEIFADWPPKKANMRTVGDGVTKLTPVIGFVAETSSTVAIEIMTALGAPVSTTQVITTSIMGAGSARRRSSVRWGVARKIIAAWFVTLPATMALGGLIAFLTSFVLA